MTTRVAHAATHPPATLAKKGLKRDPKSASSVRVTSTWQMTNAFLAGLTVQSVIPGLTSAHLARAI